MTVTHISFETDAPPPSPVLIERVEPSIDCGRYPIKREVGDTLEVTADIFREGHDKLAAVVRYRPWDEVAWSEVPMRFIDNDRWGASFPLGRNTRYLYQVEAFPDRFETWRDEILRGSDVTLKQLREEDMRLPDQSDWASAEIQRSFELRTRDRERKLLSKIDSALKRIEDGSYGYCEETQEPIGIRRLEARPIATLSIEAQERHERRERVYRED